MEYQKKKEFRPVSDKEANFNLSVRETRELFRNLTVSYRVERVEAERVAD